MNNLEILQEASRQRHIEGYVPRFVIPIPVKRTYKKVIPDEVLDKQKKFKEIAEKIIGKSL